MSETDSYDDVNENIQDGNILVDDENTFEEPDVDVSLFHVSKTIVTQYRKL